MSKNNTIQPFVIQTMIMRLSEKESLSYLKDGGFTVSRDSYYRYKRNIVNSRFDRLALIGKSQFVDQHLERIDQLELINQEMWSLYRKEKDPFKQVLILEKIAELQTYISPYYEASKWIMEDSIKNEQRKQKDNPISTT
jgi:hypothetical protein